MYYLYDYFAIWKIETFCVVGLVKAKKYNWKDSNLSLFGSDTDKQVKSKI